MTFLEWVNKQVSSPKMRKMMLESESEKERYKAYAARKRHVLTPEEREHGSRNIGNGSQVQNDKYEAEQREDKLIREGKGHLVDRPETEHLRTPILFQNPIKPTLRLMKEKIKKKKYIKICGTIGSGKSTTAKKLTEVLCGVNCSNWKNIDNPPILPYSICDCHKYSIVGKYKQNQIACGMDGICSDKKYSLDNTSLKFIEHIKIDEFNNHNSNVVIEEHVGLFTTKIQKELMNKFELYYFLLDFPIEQIIEQHKNRGSTYKIETIESKHRILRNTFEKVLTLNKYRLTGNLEQNVIDIIKISNLEPCLCMKDKKFGRKSLFDE